MRAGRRIRGLFLPPCVAFLLLLTALPPAPRAGAPSAVGILPWGAVPVAAQSSSDADPSLDRIDSLVRAGSVERAREELLGWYEARGDQASREDLQRALWLRAVLTVDPTQAALDLRRLALEYPGGPWTPGALLRLGLLAEAGDRAAEAAEHYRVLVRDHAGSEVAAAAGARLERMSADAPAPASVPAAPPGGSGEPATSGAVASDFTVQLGAFSSRDRALTLTAQAREAGFDVRMVGVPGSDLIRVRVGRFADPESATPLYDQVVARGFEAVVIPGASREVPAG